MNIYIYKGGLRERAGLPLRQEGALLLAERASRSHYNMLYVRISCLYYTVLCYTILDYTILD